MSVEEQSPTGQSEKRIVLRPNGSLDMYGARLLIGGLSITLVIVACYFAVIGCWVVVPFIAAVLIGTVYCLLHSLRQNSAFEVITVDKDRLRIAIGGQGTASHCEFQRYWANVNLVRSKLKGYPSRLAIRSHGREIEIGRFLMESERRDLALRLTGLLN